jgi:UDP-glucose 4-epimerase
VRILVTGGAGYIGAHVVRLLTQRGDEVVVVDDLSTGAGRRVGESADLVVMDLATAGFDDRLAAVLAERRIEAVIHVAAKKQVGESVARPAWYYQQNVGGMTALLLAMEAVGTAHLVFSSSAAVYGSVEGGLAREDTPPGPVNPYGATKLVGEWICQAAAAAWGVRAVSLRYFNVAGAGWPDLHDPAALNLVPIVRSHWLAGSAVPVFGDDYPTSDGTCVRDYVHVLDLAEAHLVALDRLVAGAAVPPLLNVGTGAGSSVLEVLDAVRRVTGRGVDHQIRGRRAGDPALLVADVGLIQRELGWRARRGLDEIIASAWSS